VYDAERWGMIDPDLKKYLDDLIRLQKAELGIMSEIKFELQNARKLQGSTYKIPVKTPGAWIRFKYWLKKKVS